MVTGSQTPGTRKMAKKLTRSSNNKIIAGVAGGMAQRFGVKSFWVRLVWFLLLLPGGIPGLVPYLICWIIIPKED